MDFAQLALAGFAVTTQQADFRVPIPEFPVETETENSDRKSIRQIKHQTLTQTQTVITLEFSLPNIWKAVGLKR